MDQQKSLQDAEVNSERPQTHDLEHSDPQPETAALSSRGWRFWAIFPPVCVSQLLIALESTIPIASLPKISTDLGAGDNWVWVVNAYLLTNTVLIPLFAQSAFVFGRRWTMIFAVATFILGSGIAGGAYSMTTIIAGRAVQGVGGAGVSVLGNIIISDITTVRERGKYMAIVFAAVGLGLALGPPLGGVMAESDWRWVFWLNLPFGGLSLIMLLLFLHIDAPRPLTVRQGLKRTDWAGNFLLVGSVVSILIALSWADTRFPWGSWRILVPLLVGFVGLIVFHAYQVFCANPTIPPRLFKNITAAVSFALIFSMGMLSVWRSYFLAIYLEGVLLVSASRAGVLLLPSIFVFVPASMSAGIALSKWGRYKPIHILACLLLVLSSGLYLDFNKNYSLAKVVIYQMIAGWGSGMLISTTLPAAQAVLTAADSVAASMIWAYLRIFGGIWGVAIPAAIFNSRFSVSSTSISDEGVRDALGGGNAYARVSGAYVSSLPDSIQNEVIGVYDGALRVVWYVCLALNVITLAIVFLEKEVVMRTTLDFQEQGNKPPNPQENSQKDASDERV